MLLWLRAARAFCSIRCEAMSDSRVLVTRAERWIFSPSPFPPPPSRAAYVDSLLVVRQKEVHYLLLIVNLVQWEITERLFLSPDVILYS